MAHRHTLPQETIFNKIPKFKEASDPSNIIWENRYVQKSEFRKNVIKAAVIIGAVLAVFFTGMAYFKAFSMKQMMKYQSVDCNAIMDTYKVHPEDTSLKQDAFAEFNLAHDEASQDRQEAPTLGYLQCFCDKSLDEGDTFD